MVSLGLFARDVSGFGVEGLGFSVWGLVLT